MSTLEGRDGALAGALMVGHAEGIAQAERRDMVHKQAKC